MCLIIDEWRFKHKKGNFPANFCRLTKLTIKDNYTVQILNNGVTRQVIVDTTHFIKHNLKSSKNISAYDFNLLLNNKELYLKKTEHDENGNILITDDFHP